MSPALRMYAVVALGAALGSVGRLLLSVATQALAGPGFPWGTLAVNVAGSFLVGLFATLTEPGGRVQVSAPARQFVITGFCGGLTTFSIFSLETVLLAGRDGLGAAGGNVVISLVFWLAAVWAGYRVALQVNRRAVVAAGQ